VETDLVPGQVEELVDALEAAASGFGDAQPDPDGADDGDGGEEVECAGGSEALAVEEHDGQGFVGGVLADEVHGHGDGGADGTDAEREELGGEEVLTGVPAQCPADSGEVDHGDGTRGSLRLGRRGDVVFVLRDGDDVEEDGDVEHGKCLQDNTDDERALATKSINQEQRADDGGDKFDNAYREVSTVSQTLH
jgi:hypothetical protein